MNNNIFLNYNFLFTFLLVLKSVVYSNKVEFENNAASKHIYFNFFKKWFFVNFHV